MNNLNLLTELNITYKHTGIKKIVIEIYSQGLKKSKHGPRIKVSNVYDKFRNDDCFVINIKTLKVEEGEIKIKSKELILVCKWIELNRPLLLDYWKTEPRISTRDLLEKIKRI